MPDQARAVEYLHNAATFFSDEDAQFELAKSICSATASRAMCSTPSIGSRC